MTVLYHFVPPCWEAGPPGSRGGLVLRLGAVGAQITGSL